jgi:hypothetical protein
MRSLKQLGLAHREDADSLMVAKHIVKLAGQGEPDEAVGGPWSVVATRLTIAYHSALLGRFPQADIAPDIQSLSRLHCGDGS